jgi:molybdopterin-guanine dinucleotide biosynthesis protein A
MQSLSIYILAGGNSSRMGQDKGLLLLDQRRIMETILDECKHITSSIYILTANEKYAAFNYPLIPDKIKHIGPAGGIDAMLQYTQTENNLIISCDMPFVTHAAMLELISLQEDHDITIPMFHDYPEAMFGLYKKRCKNKWREQIEKGIHKMSIIISHFTHNFVDGKCLEKKYPKLFTNINTPEELKQAQQWRKQLP